MVLIGRSKASFVAAIFLLAACAVLVYGNARERSASEKRLATLLQEYDIQERIVYKGETYIVGGENGYGYDLSILSLAYQKAAARNTPLYAMPGVDPEDFLRDVDSLSKVQQRIASSQDTERDAALIRESLYPIALLRLFANLESKRLTFLETGSSGDAAAYLSDQLSFFRRYSAAIHDFRRSFSTAVPKDIGEYATESKIIDRKGTLDALDALENAARRVDDEVRRRASCTHGHTVSCKSKDIFLPPLIPKEVPKITTESRALAQEVLTVSEKAGIRVSRSAPLFYLDDSACVLAKEPAAPLFSIETIRYTGSPLLPAAYYAGDLLMIETAPHATLPFFSYFAARGVELLPNRPTKYYRCPETGKDSGILFALRDVREFANTYRIGRIAPEERRRDISALENTLQGATVTEDDATRYLLALSQPDVMKMMDTSVRDTFIALYLEYAYRSLGTYIQLSEITHSETVNLYLNDLGVDIRPDALFFFYARSGFVTLFLGDNTSVAGAHAPLFRPNRLTERDQPFQRLSEMPHTGSTLTKLIEDLRFYTTIHEMPE